jgi:hypothetical protein
MNARSPSLPCPFDAGERDLIRREFAVQFGQAASLTEGIRLRTWQSGPQKDQPKLPAAVQSMLARGLVEVKLGGYGPRACFTAAGIAALRRLAADRRLLDPQAFAHLHRELDFAPGGSETISSS